MPQGYTKTAVGFRAWVRVSSKVDDFDELKTKRFALDATPKAIRAWRDATRAVLEQRLEQKRQQRAAELGVAGTLRADAIEYLKAVRALSTYKTRCRDIALWVEVFGDRERHSIQPHEIRAMRDHWLTVGPRRRWQKVNGVGQWVDVAGPLAASTVNHRLRALSNLFTVLDPGKPNPVHAVPEVAEPSAIPRAIDYETIRRILDAMADRGRPVKGEKRSTESLAKVRARCLAWAGVEPTELGRIPEADIIDATTTGVLVIPGRRKGEGAPGRVIPLNEDAVDALKDLVRLKATGPFHSRGVLRAWQRACITVIGKPLRLKDLRHSFVTNIVGVTKDLRLAQLLAGHTDDRTTQRYALAALLPMLRAGMDATFQPRSKETDKS